MTIIGKENSGEEVVIKVNDRRKFNLDGTLREGVVIEKKEETQPQASEQKQTAEQKTEQREKQEREKAETSEKRQDEKATLFMSFLSTIATNAATVLGMTPHPITGQKMVDLDASKYWIDVLAMLKEKTKGNLEAEEEEMLNDLLTELRLQYVQVVRMTEEKLKTQAAKKFSAKDVLGKRF